MAKEVEKTEEHRRAFVAAERFWDKVDKGQDCWVYTDYLDPNGYGKFSFMGSPVYAHRFSKSLEETLDPTKELDHLCRNKACVRPSHLEQVNHRTNVLRSPVAVAAVNNRKVFCAEGHELVRTRPGGSRRCPECKKAYNQRYYSENKERFWSYDLQRKQKFV